MRLLELFRPYRIVVSRRVAEEEQVSIESFHKSREHCERDLTAILTLFRDHRKRTNEEVVGATREQLTALDTAITARGDESRRLGDEIEKKRIEVKNLDQLLAVRRKKLGVVPLAPNGPTSSDDLIGS